MSPDDLHELALEYLAACAAALALTSAGAPDIQYVSAGPPAWDCCPALIVHVGGPSTGNTRVPSGGLGEGHRIATTGVIHLISLTATVLRCSASYGEGEDFLPSPEAETAVAAVTNADIWAITNYLVDAIADGVIFGSCQERMLDNPVTLAQQGGCAGWLVPVRFSLPGFVAIP